MNFFEYTLLAIGTMLLMFASWRVSLRAGRYHGVYRFVSFESILVLVLLNWHSWFNDPFSIGQLTSWLLLTASVVPVVLGFQALQLHGKAQLQFENTQALVTSGIYRYIRHPMYLSLMLLGTGVCLKDPTDMVVCLGVVNCIALVATALREEKEMVRRFGEEYVAYRTRSKMFIPGLI
jgi:protein-S-isoprenylcysteine O-methyltransferase Ste14